MKEMMKKHTQAKAGSPAARLMGSSGGMHRDMGGSTAGSDMGTNTGSSVARVPGADSNFSRGGSTFKAKKRAMGGAIMDTMHGTDAPTPNKDILGTFHGNSSTGARALAAGGAGKERKDYPMT